MVLVRGGDDPQYEPESQATTEVAAMCPSFAIRVGVSYSASLLLQDERRIAQSSYHDEAT
jgi:hypothetical protein